MSSVYTPTAVKLVSITIPSDGDAKSAASVNTPLNGLADGIAYMHAQIDVYADFTALRAVNVTGFANGRVAHVKNHGFYVLDTASTATELEPWVIDPTTGAGRWLSSTAHETTAARIVTPGAWPGYILGTGVSYAAASVAIGCEGPTATFSPLVAANDIDMTASFAARHKPVDAANAKLFGLWFPLDQVLINGATLSSVVLRLKGAAGHGALPAQMPRFGIGFVPRSHDLAGPSALLSTGNGLVIDGSASVAAYEAAHDVTFTPNQNNVIDRSIRSYGLSFWGEGHTNALANLQLISFQFNFTAIPDARRA